MPHLISNQKRLDWSPLVVGQLQESSDALGRWGVLRDRMHRDGYLWLRGFLDRNQVLAARDQFLAERCNGIIPGRRVLDRDFYKQPVVHRLMKSGPMIAFYDGFLGGKTLAFDNGWVRVVGPGTRGARPHCDVVYFKRGTPRFYTSWAPLGDVPIDHGPLAILEGSHVAAALDNYRTMDVDRPRSRIKHGKLMRGVSYSRDPQKVQRELGLRWLTGDISAGDCIVFAAQTMHCSLDNASEEVRLSLDCRYQLASDPVDERYLGEDPVLNVSPRWGPMSAGWDLANKVLRVSGRARK